MSFYCVDMSRDVKKLKTCRVDLAEAKSGSVMVQIVDETAKGTWLPSRERQVFAGNAGFVEAAREVLGEGALAHAVGPLKHYESALCRLLRHLPSCN